MLLRRDFVSRIHRKKPKGRAMPERTCFATAQKSISAVEHVFAHQKGLMGLFVRTIGLARARLKIGLANLAYNMRRFVWLRDRRRARVRNMGDGMAAALQATTYGTQQGHISPCAKTSVRVMPRHLRQKRIMEASSCPDGGAIRIWR
jgi:hypothetical protein